MQVIYAIWAVLPPSAWFSGDKPLYFAAMASVVLLLSSVLAWLQNRFWTALLGTSAAQEPAAAAKNAERVNMHVHAGVPAN